MKNKIFITLLAFILISTTLFTGCQKDEFTNSNNKSVILKVGASPVPHAEILEIIKDNLKDQNIELKIIEFTDYIKPNLALADGDIDANFFQHIPYMKSFAEDNNINIVSLGKIHIEPMGLYSQRISNIDELKDGATIAIPSDPTNGGRALLLLQENNLIKLDDSKGLEATEKDIVSNPKNLIFKPLEAAQLPRVLQDVDGAIINGNYAIEAGFNPSKNSILIENGNSPYANIITIRQGEDNNPNITALLKALQSKEVRNFIDEKYKGGVIPAF